jgi:hypothetical protein
MFVLPGGKAIEKISNLSRLLAKRLETNVPSATAVRKMGTTAVARVCTRQQLQMVTRNMNHDAENYYECVRADGDAARMYHTIEQLRKDSTHEGTRVERDNPDDSDEDTIREDVSFLVLANNV